MERLLSCRPSCFGPYADRALPEIAALGVRYVELGLPGPGDLPELQKQLAGEGLTVASVQTSLDLRQEGCVEAYRAQAEAAAALGASYLFLPLDRAGVPRERVIDHLLDLGDLLGEFGQTVVFETHPDMFGNADQAVATFTELDHPNLGLNFDTGNIYYYNEQPDLMAQLARVVTFVESVHLKDTHGARGVFDFPALGEGIVDFPAVFAQFEADGFEGPYTLEIEGKAGEELPFEAVRERVVKSLAYLRRHGF